MPIRARVFEEGLGPRVLLEDPQVCRSCADGQIHEIGGDTGAAMPGGYVQAHELKIRSVRVIGLRPADDAYQRVGGLGEGDLASTRPQPVMPADLTVLGVDSVEICLRDQVAVGLSPTLGLELRDGTNVRQDGLPQLGRCAALGGGAACHHIDHLGSERATSPLVGSVRRSLSGRRELPDLHDRRDRHCHRGGGASRRTRSSTSRANARVRLALPSRGGSLGFQGRERSA
jgi:hypothetical protein